MHVSQLEQEAEMERCAHPRKGEEGGGTPCYEPALPTTLLAEILRQTAGCLRCFERTF